MAMPSGTGDLDVLHSISVPVLAPRRLIKTASRAFKIVLEVPDSMAKDARFQTKEDDNKRGRSNRVAWRI